MFCHFVACDKLVEPDASLDRAQALASRYRASFAPLAASTQTRLRMRLQSRFSYLQPFFCGVGAITGIPADVLSRAREVAEFEDKGEPIQARTARQRKSGPVTLVSSKVSQPQRRFFAGTRRVWFSPSRFFK